MLPLPLRIGVGKHRTRLPESEAKRTEETLTLSYTKLNFILSTDPVGQRLPIPHVRLYPVLPWRLAEDFRSSVKLLLRKARRPARPRSFRQARHPFTVETVDPILHRPRRIPEKLRRTSCAQALGDHQNGVKAVVVPSMLSPSDLILESHHHHIGIFDLECSHANTLAHSGPMRKYLCRRV